MASIFTRSNDATPSPNRNTFDLSFVNNLTTKFGQITPIMCKPVLPNDSANIDLTFGFNLAQMVFPVQTKIRADVHFFYVRNRALWRGWQSFITKTDDPNNDTTPPYICLTEQNRDMFETGNIGDYLGVPTVMYKDTYVTRDAALVQGVRDDFNNYGYFTTHVRQQFGSFSSTSDPLTNVSKFYSSIGTEGKNAIFPSLPFVSVTGSLDRPYYNLPYTDTSLSNTPYWQYHFGGYFFNAYLDAQDLSGPIYQLLDSGNYSFRSITGHTEEYPFYVAFTNGPLSHDFKEENLIAHACCSLAEDGLRCYNYSNLELSVETAFENYSTVSSMTLISGGSASLYATPDLLTSDIYCYVVPLAVLNGSASAPLDVISTTYDLDASDGLPNSFLKLQELPFFNSYTSGDDTDTLKISALPFRAVEACYNSFYRDERNNPLIENGKTLYNKWITTDHGGIDVNHYKLYQRNWQEDVFTTAVQSPQQGVAPLVGVTGTGTMTFQDEDGKTYTLQATVGEDGHTLTGISSYSSDMPVGTLRAMVDTISSGISINDFRNVNALQRWLETNMRKGLRYKDQIEAHFGVSPTYSELDMPEFIGGMSREIDMNRVIQTSESTTSPLGTLAGNGSVLGSGGSTISKFFDEHGWIIGFITFSPVPVYSQCLDKELLKSNILDYYFPEFAHIGYQPILNREIAPLQCNKNNPGQSLTDVFGYQRAWYEYLSSIDEVHGEFRSSLRDYLIHRVYNGVPELGSEFLTIDPAVANHVFAVEEDDPKIYGQLYFDFKMKRPIPKIGIPRLEVG